MKTSLPPLRALQAFEAFGRLGSITAAASSLGVTSGAISQQLRLLEEHVGAVLLVKDGRRATLTPTARTYHGLISQGFGRLMLAQDYILSHRQSEELTISGFPTLMSHFLNPRLSEFQAQRKDVAIRVVATHQDSDPYMLEQTFRLTYGEASRQYMHTRILYTDHCLPVCSPDFLARFPGARDPAQLIDLPLIGIDWGKNYSTEPHWRDWFIRMGLQDTAIRHSAVYSVSGLALQAAVAGQGAVLGQASFVHEALRAGQLVRLSDDSLPMPDPYHICWGPTTLERPIARDFLNWIMQITKPMRSATAQQG